MPNLKIYLFVVIMTAVVAFSLAFMFTGLKPIHDKNEAIYNKKAILSSINAHLGQKATDLSDEEAEAIFQNHIKSVVVDIDGDVLDGIMAEDVEMEKEEKKADAARQWPVYLYDDGTERFYILSVYGSGLWDKIWGCIALEEDLNTIAGVSFDHKGETPGLGAEIKDNPSYPRQFIGKKLYATDGTFKSVRNVKGGVKDVDHEVDVISGATVTSDGVSEMMYRGLAYYADYLKKEEQTTGKLN